MSLVQKPTKSTTHPFLQVEIHYDEHPHRPELCGTISYNSRSHYVLGTVGLDSEQDDAVAAGVRNGSLIGMPVFAYVHSGISLTAAESNPYHCQWDSGRSGWVYTTRAAARAYLNVKRLTKANVNYILDTLREDVQMFSAYLNNECYGFVIRDKRTDEALDSCWGYYGLDSVEADAASALKQMEAITPCQLELAL